MWLRRAYRTLARWALVAVFGALLTINVASLFWRLDIQSAAHGAVVSVSRGALYVRWWDARHLIVDFRRSDYWEIKRHTALRMAIVPRLNLKDPYITAFIPLWIPTGLCGLAALLFRRAIPPNNPMRCVECGYDLRGLAPTAHCPECGRQRSAAFRPDEFLPYPEA